MLEVADSGMHGVGEVIRKQPEVTDEQMDGALPIPSGYKILIALPEANKTYGPSGILKPDTVVKQDEVSTVIGLVLDVGPDAYKDTAKFPSGPWCQPGDFVLIRAYSGTRFRIYDKEFRLINDDTVEAVVKDPSGYSRA
jgi:co-chaperonin GroES (HSP10)